jgi:hypothetical protein
MLPTKVRFKSLLNVPKVRKKVEEARDKALDRAGIITMRSARKQLRSRQPLKKPIWKMVGTYEGYPLVSMSFEESTKGKVTTWKPKEFLRRKIFYSPDKRKGSVVVGPDEKVASVQQLQEFGGSEPVKLKLVSPFPVANLYQYKVPASMLGGRQGRDRRGRFISNKRAYVGMWHSQKARVRGKKKTVATAPGKVPGAGFMGKGIEAVKTKIPAQFRNQLRGP